MPSVISRSRSRLVGFSAISLFLLIHDFCYRMILRHHAVAHQIPKRFFMRTAHIVNIGSKNVPESKLKQIVHELPEAEQVCAECGELLHVCGHQVLHRELAYVPAQYRSICRPHTAAAIVRERMIMRKSRQ